MLGKSRAVTTIAVTDMERARKFYEGKLGLDKPEMRMDGAEYKLGGGTRIFLYGRPSPPKADHTLVAFEVDDLARAVKDLRKRGVKFEEYDIPEMGLKTIDGIATIEGEKSAWCKDPDGNILAVVETVPERTGARREVAHA